MRCDVFLQINFTVPQSAGLWFVWGPTKLGSCSGERRVNIGLPPHHPSTITLSGFGASFCGFLLFLGMNEMNDNYECRLVT